MLGHVTVSTLCVWRREVFDRECLELVHASETASEKLRQLRADIVQKDDAVARLRADVLAASQTLQQLEKQCSRTQNQLDSELSTKEQLQRR